MHITKKRKHTQKKITRKHKHKHTQKKITRKHKHTQKRIKKRYDKNNEEKLVDDSISVYNIETNSGNVINGMRDFLHKKKFIL